MSEKAVAIGCYFVASGIEVVLGHPFHVGGSPAVDRYLTGGMRDDFGASFHVCSDPLEAAAKVMALIEAKRDKLGINRKQDRKLYDMKDRRGLVV
jgi:carbon-monoxide dehydrogenase catalytic subunit